MLENLNEVNLKFNEMNFTLILVEEVDLMKELLFKLKPKFTEEYEYSTIVDLSEEKLKQPENRIFKEAEDNSELRDIMIDIMKFSNIVSVNEDEAQIYIEKILTGVGKKTYEYIYTLKLKKFSKISKVMVESEMGNINMLNSNIIDYNDAYKEKFIKMQNQVDETNLKIDDVITKNNELLSKFSVLSEVSEKILRESEQLKNKCIAYENQVEVGRNQIQNLSISLDTAHTDILNSKNTIDFLKNEQEATNDRLEAANAMLEATNATLEATNARLVATNATLAATNARLESTNARLEATNARLENLKAEHVDTVELHDITKADLEVSKREIENLKRGLNETKVELGNSKREQANLVNQISNTNGKLNSVVKDLKETHIMLSDILPDYSLINNRNEKDRFCSSFNKFKKEFKAMYDSYYNLIENKKEVIQEKQKEKVKEIIKNDIIIVPEFKEIKVINLKTVITNYEKNEERNMNTEDFSFMMNTIHQAGIESRQRLRFINNSCRYTFCENDNFVILTDGTIKIAFFTQKPFGDESNNYSSKSRVLIFDLTKKQFKVNSNKDDKGELSCNDEFFVGSLNIGFISDGEEFGIYIDCKNFTFTFKSLKTELNRKNLQIELYQLE